MRFQWRVAIEFDYYREMQGGPRPRWALVEIEEYPTAGVHTDESCEEVVGVRHGVWTKPLKSCCWNWQVEHSVWWERPVSEECDPSGPLMATVFEGFGQTPW